MKRCLILTGGPDAGASPPRHARGSVDKHALHLKNGVLILEWTQARVKDMAQRDQQAEAGP